MNLFICVVATALAFAAGSGFQVGAQAAEDIEVAALRLTSCPPETATLSPECAAQICTSVSSATELDAAEQALIGRDIAVLIRDFGATDTANAAVIDACIAAGPNGLFAAYNGSEIARVSEGVPASEQ